ncbi:hypothetical protein [Methylomonas sp. AM2-LC]|uniref:hypothetical protein n=1 Tax=Methylomonas sp. AM2-LC TaxID=3153301 RepID=UPI0032662C27
MVEYERVFSENCLPAGDVKWYFEAREGDCGPYETKCQAMAMLDAFINECISKKNTGGRAPDAKPCLEVMPNNKTRFIYPFPNELSLSS